MIDIKSLTELINAYMELGEPEMLKYAFLVSIVISLSVIAVFFILRGIGLYRLNTRLGNRCAFLAFVPGLSGYALGAAADGLKKRKPSNYQIHMLMLGLFQFVLNAVYYIYFGGRMVYLYEKLTAGGEVDVEALLTRVFTVERGNHPLYIAMVALSLLEYVVLFVSLLCYMRILQLYRRGGFFILMLSLFVPQVMDVYLFAMRNSPIHEHPPVFQMPGGTTFGGTDFDGKGDENGDGGDDNPYSYGDIPRNEDPDETDGDRRDVTDDRANDGDDNDPPADGGSSDNDSDNETRL